MKRYLKASIETFVLEDVICDCCGEEFDAEMDCMAINEFLHIDFIAGYDTAFEDGDKVVGDFCSACVKKLLGKYLRIYDSEKGIEDALKL